MIIGDDFNSKAKQLLQSVYEKSEGEEGKRVKVELLSNEMELDKTEAKNLIEYLESKDCLKIETMGGPYLYGDVSITKKGIAKSKK